MDDLWRWLVDPRNASVVGALGLVMGAFGFPLTLVQLWRTKRAADAAKKAAESATVRLNTFNAMRECEQARTQARGVNEAIARLDWDATLVSYQNVALSLMHLSQSNVPFDSEVQASLAASLKKITENCGVLEKAIKTDPTKLSKGKQFSALRPIDTTIAKATFNLERLSS